MQKEIRRQIEIDKLMALKKKYKIEKITDFHYRVNGVVDIFPTNKKMHNLRTHVWGDYEDLKKALNIEVSKATTLANINENESIAEEFLTKKDAKILKLLLVLLTLFSLGLLITLIAYGEACNM
jgi:hypothetical protein